MTSYAAKEASKARLAAKQRQEADADGFITVARGGRTNPAKQEAAQELAEKQKEKQKGLDDFYRYQSREKRKQRAGELVRKFEEDKERVRRMKERRGRFRVSLCIFTRGGFCLLTDSMHSRSESIHHNREFVQTSTIRALKHTNITMAGPR